MRFAPKAISLSVDDRDIEVFPGTSVAVAILMTGQNALRKSVSGEPRGPLCGMGICFECRVMIDGQPHCRSCQIECAPGMRVATK